MVYEAHQPQRFNYVMAGLCAALSLLGFIAAGVIPTESTTRHGAHPLVGWAIVAGCFAVAAIFVRRALDTRPQLRLDANGIWSRRYSDATVPWDQIVGVGIHPMRNQMVVSFHLKNPENWPSNSAFTRAAGGMDRAFGWGEMAVNASFLTGGPAGLIGAVRHFRPDLFPEG
jgi:hypothetical protein